MHAIFAIEPEAINNWQDLRYTLEKFGYSKGLLIARYPKTWMRLVMEACRSRGVGDIELKRIEEKLHSAKDDRLVRVGLPYEGSGWLESVNSEAVLSQLSAVLVRNQVGLDKFHRIDDAHENLFENRRDFCVKRNANALAEVAKYVLVVSDQVVLVDPYFQSRRKCIKVLNAMLSICMANGDLPNHIFIFTDHSTDSRQSAVVKLDYEGLLNAWVQRGIRFTIFRVAGNQLEQDFHARYLFNQKAGLRFDRGFVEPEDHGAREHMTDVSCMDAAFVNVLYTRFIDERGSLEVIDEILL
jgi:hypothetical protein